MNQLPSHCPRSSSTDSMALPEQGAGHPPASAAAAADPNLLALPGAGGDTEEPERGEVASLACPPDDALMEILSRVPIKSRCRFKCVCKAWCDLITDRLRCRAFPQTLEGFFYFDCEARGVGGRSDDDNSYGSGGGNGDGNNGDSGTGDGSGHGHFTDLLGRSVPLFDSPFSFLLKHPGIVIIRCIHSCNGLFLFEHRRPLDRHNSLGYIVCNPATEQWVAVPNSGSKLHHPDLYDDPQFGLDQVNATLIFDPAVSQDFQLIQFVRDHDGAEVHGYSSKTRVWSRWCDRDAIMNPCRGSAFLSGMLHLIVSGFNVDDTIVAIGAEGKTYKTICWPKNRGCLVFIGQSQGHMYCMSEHTDIDTKELVLSIWVLEDYDKEEWVLKHAMGLFQLFKRTGYPIDDDFIFSSDVGTKPIRPNYYLVSIHPDCNLVFFLQAWNRKLISYNMDSKEVCTLRMLGPGYQCISSYVPCLMESSALGKNGLPRTTKEGYGWLKNAIAGISKVKMAIQNYFTQ